MKSWKDLTNFQRALIGVVIVIAAAVLPEIAFLINFGGAELAFTLILATLTPFISWLSTKYQSVKTNLFIAYVAYKESASAKPSVFLLQFSFCAIALLLTGPVLTGSGAFAFSFFLPSMLLNGVLV